METTMTITEQRLRAEHYNESELERRIETAWYLVYVCFEGVIPQQN